MTRKDDDGVVIKTDLDDEAAHNDNVVGTDVPCNEEYDDETEWDGGVNSPLTSIGLLHNPTIKRTNFSKRTGSLFCLCISLYCVALNSQSQTSTVFGTCKRDWFGHFSSLGDDSGLFLVSLHPSRSIVLTSGAG
jgi:hypothetical protein